MKAYEIMTEDPVFINPETTVGQALSKLFELDIRHLPVVEKGELVGMISDRDLRTNTPALMDAILNRSHVASLFNKSVSEIMESDLITVNPDDDILQVVDLFLEYKIGALPVIDSQEGNLLGIISYIDVLKALKEDLHLQKQ